jgi:N-acetylneuraminic acid mutarotase
MDNNCNADLSSSMCPSGRLQHSAVSHESKIFIFGGEPDQFRQLNDIWCLDTTTMKWDTPQVSGEEPSARVSATGCLINNKIYYFGGYDGF